MEFTEKEIKDIFVLEVNGRVDTKNYNELETKFNEITGNGAGKILVDLAKMNYISSSGLRVFLMTLKKVKAAGGKFVICAMQNNIKEVFEISGFTNFFEIHSTQDEAVNVM